MAIDGRQGPDGLRTLQRHRLVATLLGFDLLVLRISLVRLGWNPVPMVRNLGRRIHSESREFTKWLRYNLTDDIPALWLLAITAVGLTVRAYFLAQPMRYDEAFTFLHFINGPWHRTFFYPLPNNHILHSLLVRASVQIFGGHPVTIRLPSFLAGTCVVPASFFLARLANGKRSGFLASALAAVFPYLVLYDTMARGYSLLVLLSVCLAILGFWFSQRPSAGLCWWMSLTAACGLLTMPSFLFLATGFFAWMVVTLLIAQRAPGWILTRFLLPCAAITVTLTGLFYAPTIIQHNGVHTLVGNRFVKSLPWPAFAEQLPGHLLHTAKQLTRGVPAPLLVVGLLLSVIGLYQLVRRRRWKALTLFPSLVLGGGAVLFAKRAIPFHRTWIYLLPFGFVLLDAGFARVTSFAAKRIRSLVLFLAVCSSILLMSRNVIASYPDTGHFPEAPVVADFLATRMSYGDEVVVKTPADAPLRFYMWYKGLPRNESPSATRKKFLVVKKSRYTLSDLTEHNARRILAIGDAEVYVLDLR